MHIHTYQADIDGLDAAERLPLHVAMQHGHVMLIFYYIRLYYANIIVIY